MDGVVEDEKKPFDSITAPDDDSHPDPDEELMLDQGQGKVWLVKIPKFLMERWAAVDAEDVHLASIRIYEADPEDPNPHKKHKIILFLPPNRDPSNAIPNGSFHSLNGSLQALEVASPRAVTPTPTPNNSQANSNSSTSGGAPSPSPTPTPTLQKPAPISLIHPDIASWPFFDPARTIPTTGSDPDIYEIEMVNDNVENQIVVAERQRDKLYSSSTPYNPRARMVILTGRIKHECNVRPAFSTTYRRQMRERHRKYNTPVRQIRMIEEKDVSGGRGGINRLSSGVGLGAGRAFTDLIKTKPKHTKGTFERMARMPRNQLLDQLFTAFRDQPRWSIKVLREKTQQPEAYLKEVMSEIAHLHRSGEYNGFWELKPDYKDDTMNAESVPLPMGSLAGDMKMEVMDDEDDDDDDDEDMEEVS